MHPRLSMIVPSLKHHFLDQAGEKRLMYSSPFMRSTGIPTYVMHLQALESQSAQLRSIGNMFGEMVEAVSSKVEGTVRSVLENHAHQLGQMTPHAVVDLVKSSVGDAVHAALVQHGVVALAGQHLPAAPVPAADIAPPVGPPAAGVFVWGGGFHRVPEGWRMPREVLIRLGWFMWLFGMQDGGICPFRSLKRNAVHPNDYARFSAWRAFFLKLEFVLRNTNHWVANPTLQQAEDMLNHLTPKDVQSET